MIERKFKRLTVREENETAASREAAARRRPLAAVHAAAATFAAERRSIWPTLAPLLIGFALLLALIVGLGSLSLGRLNAVSRRILDLERQHASQLSLLLRLRIAATKLNNETRARAEAEARSEIISPFAMPLRSARNQARELLPLFERLPIAHSEGGLALSNNLARFIEATENLEQYSLGGFERFRQIDAQLDNMLRDANREQDDILRVSEEMRGQAANNIRWLTLLAVMIGAIVTAGTIWEVQQRFRQMRQSLQQVRRERQFSAQMLEGMVSAVAAVDAQDRIRSANAAFFEVFPEASVGASVHDKFAAPEAMKMLEAATSAGAQKQESTYCGRWLLTDRDQTKAGQTFDVYSSPLEINAERGQIITLVDVTEVAEAESELRKKASLAAVGQAAAQVAHEIKNPLGSIRLGVAMLREMVKDAAATTTIDLVERGINHLGRLTTDVTQFSRHKPLSLAEVDLCELINESLELVTDRIAEKKTVVEKQCASGSLQGQLDADQLRQVLVNLFANAVDASTEGKPLIISAERIMRNDSSNGRSVAAATTAAARQLPFARIKITDHGCGMDETTLTHLFEPFYTTKVSGTGLGLAMVKKIIGQHGGNITVASTLEQGTIFTIELPLTREIG